MQNIELEIVYVNVSVTFFFIHEEIAWQIRLREGRHNLITVMGNNAN